MVRVVWGVKNSTNCRTVPELSVIFIQRQEAGVVNHPTSQGRYCYDNGPINEVSTEPTSSDLSLHESSLLGKTTSTEGEADLECIVGVEYVRVLGKPRGSSQEQSLHGDWQC